MEILKPVPKEVRLTIYELMLADYLNDPEFKVMGGLCSALRMVCLNSPYPSSNYHIENYPELMRHKPKDVYIWQHWWPNIGEEGYNVRVNILREAIAELSNQS